MVGNEEKVKKEAEQTEFVTVFYMEYDWSDPEQRIHRWKLIVSKGNELTWAYTYNPVLTRYGTVRVEFYRDASMRLCIRVPKKKEQQ